MEISHPVDRGWSWVILLGCTINMTLAIGTIKAFGIYFVEFLSVFEASVSITSLITGILQATYSLIALPIMTIGLRYISVRQSVFIGGCFMSLAYLLGSFAPSAEFLLLSNGFLFGLGFGMTHGPTTFLISLYFEKRRNLANAILVSGGSFGGLVFPQVYRFLLDQLELRGALIITSGMLLQSVVGASLLRPTGFYKSKQENTKNSDLFDAVDDKYRERSMTDPVNGVVTSLQIKESELSESKRSNSDHFINVNGKNPRLSDNIDSSSSRTLDRISESNIVRLTSKADLYTSSLSAFGSKSKLNHETFSNTNRANEKSTHVIKFKLLKNPLMILIMVSFSFGTVGSAYGSVFIAPYAKDSGIDDQAISIIISVINGCDFAGRFLAGLLSDRKCVKSHVLVAICLTVCSINMFLSFLCTELWSIVIFSVVHGLLAGALVALIPSIIIDFLGIESYRTAMGLTLLSQGLVMSTGLPVIGLIRDYTGTYLSSFQFVGSCFLMSSIALFVEPCFRSYRINNKENETEIITEYEEKLVKPEKKV